MERPAPARGRSGAVWSLAWRTCRASPRTSFGRAVVPRVYRVFAGFLTKPEQELSRGPRNEPEGG
jgi:hypothetical protein